MLHVFEALVGIWIAWLIRKALIAHYVNKRLCSAPAMATAMYCK
jgi:hypothetical protein